MTKVGRVGLAVSLASLSLVGCGAAEAKEKAPKTTVEVVSDWSNDYEGYREVVINGRHCIENKDAKDAMGSAGSGGISCDWSKS